MKRIRAHLSYANVAATLALLFAMSGGAIAATGGFSSGGTLRACVNEEGGLKLLKAGGHCGRGRKAVAWNMTGPAGAKGATGAAGANGAAGAAGAQGKEGAKGADGTFVGPQLKQFFMKGGKETPVSTVLNVDGIVLKAGCDAATSPIATIENVSGVGAELHGLVNGNGAPATVTGVPNSNFTTAISILGGLSVGSGHLTVARTDGVVVSIMWSMDDPTTLGGQSVCTFNGSAIAS